MSPNRHRTLLNMINDSGRCSTLIKPLKSCISPRSANKNILPPWDTSRCGLEAWEKTSKCYRIVTVDSSTQNASLTMPLQNSAAGFDHPRSTGVQSPKSYFGGFFCARLAWLFYMAGRAGASSGAPVPVVRLINPVRSVSSFDHGDGGKQMNYRSPVMLKLVRNPFGLCFPFPPISFARHGSTVSRLHEPRERE